MNQARDADVLLMRARPSEQTLRWLLEAEKKWTYPIRDWPRALHQFAMYFPGRVPLAG